MTGFRLQHDGGVVKPGQHAHILVGIGGDRHQCTRAVLDLGKLGFGLEHRNCGIGALLGPLRLEIRRSDHCGAATFHHHSDRPDGL